MVVRVPRLQETAFYLYWLYSMKPDSNNIAIRRAVGRVQDVTGDIAYHLYWLYSIAQPLLSCTMCWTYRIRTCTNLCGLNDSYMVRVRYFEQTIGNSCY